MRYIRPRKRSGIVPFLLGFLTGLVLFVVIFAIILGYVYYGFTIRSAEKFLTIGNSETVLINDNSPLSFAKDLTLNEMVQALKGSIDSENGLSISSLNAALGEGNEISTKKLLTSLGIDLDMDKLDAYINEYSSYNGLNEVPFNQLANTIASFITKINLGDALDLADIFAKLVNMDEKYFTNLYTQFKLDSFDELISYIGTETENANLKSLKDVNLQTLQETLKNVLQLARIEDVFGVIDSLTASEDKIYTIVSSMLNQFKIEYTVSELKNLVKGLEDIFGTDYSVLTMVQNIGLLFTSPIYEVMDINDRTIMQNLPITNTDTLADLGFILNNYFGDIQLNFIECTENDNTNSFTTNIYLELTIKQLANDEDLCDDSLASIIFGKEEINNGIFALNAVKNSTPSDYIAENIDVFDDVLLSNFIDLELLNISDEFNQLKNMTLSQLASSETAKEIYLKDVLNFKYSIIYNPGIYSGSIYELFASNYKNIRLCDLVNLGINLSSSNEEDSGVMTTLSINTKLSDILNLDVEKIFGDLSIKEILEKSTGKTYDTGLISALGYVKATDLLTKENLLDCFKNTDVTIGTLLGDSFGSDSSILKSLANIRIGNLSEDINKLTVGDILGIEKIDNEYQTDNTIIAAIADKTITDLVNFDFTTLIVGDLLGLEKIGDKYQTDNIVISIIADKTISELTTFDFTSLVVGEILGLSKDLEDKYVSDNTLVSLIANKTIKELTEFNVSDYTLGELLGIDNNSSKMLQAIKDFTISNIGSGIETLKISDIIDITSDDAIMNLIKDKTISEIAGIDFTEYTVAEILGLEKVNGEYDTNNIIKLIADNTINDLSNGNFDISALTVGDILQLNDVIYNTESGKYEYVGSGEAPASIILAIYGMKISELSSNFGDLTVGDILTIDNASTGIISNIKNTKINDLSGKLNNLTVGEVLNISGMEYNSVNNEYFYNGPISDKPSNIIIAIYGKKINELSSVIDDLTIGDVLDIESGSMLQNLDTTKKINQIQEAINELEVKAMFDISENSFLNLIPDGTTLANLSTTTINISNVTIAELITMGFVADNGYSDDIKNMTVQDILDFVNSYSGLIS